MARSPARLSLPMGAAIGSACWLILSILQALGAFDTADLRLLDWRFRLRGFRVASDSIAIVEVDDRTIAAYGRWPLPREAYAVLLEALRTAGAGPVGVDLQFLDEERDDHMADILLAEVTSRSGRLVHAFTFIPEDPSLGGASAPPRSLALLSPHGARGQAQRLGRASRVSLPYEGLLRASLMLGHVSVAVDRDGVIRRVPLLVRFGPRIYPALVLRMALGGTPEMAQIRVVSAGSGAVEIQVPGGRRLRIPIDSQGATAIDFAGDEEAFHRRFSMLDVLGMYRDGDSTGLRRSLGGRYVLIGATAVAQAVTDLGATPFRESTPLLYVHANALDAALRGRWLSGISPWVMQPLSLLVALALGLAFARLSPGRSLLLLAGALLAAGSASFGLLAWAGVMLPTAAALLLPPLSYASAETGRLLFLERSTRERDKEMRLARTIQQGLLPKEPPRVAGLDVHGMNVPAMEVGGDYFDWIARDGRLLVVIGDVSGKGVAASLLMSHLHAAFHASAQGTSDPLEIATAMHASLCRAVQQGRFATLFVALVDPASGRVRYCNAGHNPPYLVRKDREEALEATGIPLGMIETATYEAAETRFGPGDTLVLYSDGVTECPFKSEMYGEERLEGLLRREVRAGHEARRIVEALHADLEAFAHGNPGEDDITITVVRHTRI